MKISEVLKVGLTLFIITALAAALLAFVNGKTAPLIEKNSFEKERQALRAVLPEAAEFTPAELDFDDELVTGAYAARDWSGNIVGACVITETSGYDVGIQTVTGVDVNLKVTGVEIISMNETPGLGAKASEEGFRSQYKGKSGVIGVSKNGADAENIQAISGATKTSDGVTAGVNSALRAAGKILEGGDDK